MDDYMLENNQNVYMLAARENTFGLALDYSERFRNSRKDSMVLTIPNIESLVSAALIKNSREKHVLI